MDTENKQHARAWLAAVVLAMAAMIAMADKTLPMLLMEPIKHAMALTDVQIGILTGFTFAIAMAIAALPLAWLADRYDRTLLLAIAITVWCLLTIASGFATNFTALFLCRLGVGLGEAALIPAALSLIADLFPLRRVARASGLFFFGVTFGGVVAMVGGGAVYGYLHAAALEGTLPLASDDAWRWTTIAFGAAGLVVAALVVTILPEPRRRNPAMAAAAIGTPEAAGFREYLTATLPFILLLVICLGMSAIFTVGFNGWLAPFFTRTYGWSIERTGSTLGTILLVAGLLSPFIGVFFNQIVRRWMGREAPLAAISLMLLVILPFVIGGPLMSNGLWAAAAVGIVIAISGGCSIVISVIYVSIAPSHLRARITAVLLLVLGLISGAGTVVYAGFTDIVLGDPSRIHLTMSLLSGLLILFTAITSFFVDRRYPAVVAMAKEAELRHLGSGAADPRGHELSATN
ncbi:MFS transporter [Paracoccus binzhouensis]|uniref:MFS transporter n=1 Tax=Paracoccus binzhouensis TaxID=2796149 RepID=UPI0018EF119A|nr:MFS transporter [Paracoccus binzhouensis]